MTGQSGPLNCCASLFTMPPCQRALAAALLSATRLQFPAG